MSVSISGLTLSDYINNTEHQTLSSYIYNYIPQTVDYLKDHNNFVSTAIYGNFYNYDYTDLSNNVIVPANSYIQRDISISGNIYCSSLYDNIANQIAQTIYSISGIITLDLLEYTKNITFNNYKVSNDLYVISLSGSIQSLNTLFQI